MSKFEVIRGVEGCCLALDDTRIAGPKPWGGGTVIHAWETDKEYKASDMQSRWNELFGTPDRAARTIADISERVNLDRIGGDYDALLGFDGIGGDYDELLEWLRGESDGK